MRFKYLASSILAVSAGVVIIAGCSDPIPLEDYPEDYIGAPFTAKPLSPKNVWEHPTYGGGTTFSTTMHSDHYNSDVMPLAGPLGDEPILSFQDMGIDIGGICSTPRITHDGNILVPCQDGILPLRKRKLVLMDPDMNIIAESASGVWTGASETTSSVPGGVYLHVRSDGTVLNGSADMKVEQFELDGSGTEYLRTEIRDLDAFSPGDALFEIAEDGTDASGGNLWFVTLGSGSPAGVVVGYIESGDWSTSAIHTFPILAGEITENGFAIGEDGVFVLTDTKLYSFGIKDDGTGDLFINWEYAYDVTTNTRPEFVSKGSGSTTTLLGDDLISIADNADGQVNLIVMRREAGGYASAEDRIVCKIPLFNNGASAVDVSPIGYDDGKGNASLVISNWSGNDPLGAILGIPTPPIAGSMSNMVGGMSRYDINGRNPGDGCSLIWNRPDVTYTTVAKLSTATGLIYTYTQDRSYTIGNAYYFEAIDFENGNTAFKKLTGVDEKTGGTLTAKYTNGMLTLALAPNGAIYQGVFGGILKLQDQ